ncbi:MAG: metallothionein [Helicobacteraceae bacterium]|jgi:uncharacterized protein|nr:metallothionein [Helicobacteraceae bacterium]
MFRIILVAALLGAIYFLVFRKRLKPPKNDATDMIECANCGSYVAADEAITKRGKTYCSQACAEAKQ